jgi:hypothetical protein
VLQFASEYLLEKGGGSCRRRWFGVVVVAADSGWRRRLLVPFSCDNSTGNLFNNVGVLEHSNKKFRTPPGTLLLLLLP